MDDCVFCEAWLLSKLKKQQKVQVYKILIYIFRYGVEIEVVWIIEIIVLIFLHTSAYVNVYFNFHSKSISVIFTTYFVWLNDFPKLNKIRKPFKIKI